MEFSDLPTCRGAPVDLVAHHVHLLLVVRPAEELRVLDHILVAGAQPLAAHHAHETLFVEHALARPHHQFPGRDVIAATAATPVHAPVADKKPERWGPDSKTVLFPAVVSSPPVWVRLGRALVSGRNRAQRSCSVGPGGKRTGNPVPSRPIFATCHSVTKTHFVVTACAVLRDAILSKAQSTFSIGRKNKNVHCVGRTRFTRRPLPTGFLYRVSCGDRIVF